MRLLAERETRLYPGHQRGKRRGRRIRSFRASGFFWTVSEFLFPWSKPSWMSLPDCSNHLGGCFRPVCSSDPGTVQRVTPPPPSLDPSSQEQNYSHNLHLCFHRFRSAVSIDEVKVRPSYPQRGGCVLTHGCSSSPLQAPHRCRKSPPGFPHRSA